MTFGVTETVHDFSDISAEPYHVFFAAYGGTGSKLVRTGGASGELWRIFGTSSRLSWANTSPAYGDVVGWNDSALVAYRDTIRSITPSGQTVFGTSSGGIWMEQVAVAPDGTVWATTRSYEIFKFSSSGTLLRRYNQCPEGSTSIGFGPDGLLYLGAYAYGNSTTGLSVVDPDDEFDAGGGDWRLPFTLISSTVPAAGQIHGVAVYDGRVYYSGDWGGHQVLSVSTSGGSVTTEVSGISSGYQNIHGLHVNGSYLYGASPFDHKVYRWALDYPTPHLGAQETVYTMPPRSTMWAGTTYGSSAPTSPVSPVSVAIDGDDMFIGTTDSADGPVLKVTNFRDPDVWYDQSNISVVVDINDGEYVQVHNNKLYICNDDESNDSIYSAGLYRCDLDGSNLELLFDLTNDPAVSAFGAIPHKANFHPVTGDIWLSSWSQRYLFHLDPDGSLIQTYSLQYGGSPILLFGGGWYGGELYLQDVDSGNVYKFNPDTAAVSLVFRAADSIAAVDEGLPGTGTNDLVVTDEGRIFGLTDIGGIWSVLVDGSDFTMERSWSSGWPMDYPLNLLLHDDGYLYVADFGEHWVYRWQVFGEGSLGWQVGSVAMAAGSQGFSCSPCPTIRWSYPNGDSGLDLMAVSPDGQTLIGAPSDGGSPDKPVITGYDYSDPLATPPVLYQYPRDDSLFNDPYNAWFEFDHNLGSSDGTWFYAWHGDWVGPTYLTRLLRCRLSDGFQEIIHTVNWSDESGGEVSGLAYSHYDSKLYWIEEAPSGSVTRMRRINGDGSGLETASTRTRSGGIGHYAYQGDRIAFDSNGGVWTRSVDQVIPTDTVERVNGFIRYDIDTASEQLFSYAHMVPHETLIPAIPRFYTGSLICDGTKVYANFYWRLGTFSPAYPPGEVNGYYYPNMGISCNQSGNFDVYNKDIYNNDHVHDELTGMGEYVEGSSGDYKGSSWARFDPCCPDLLVSIQQTGANGSFKTTRDVTSLGQDASYRGYYRFSNWTSTTTGLSYGAILRTR